MNLEGINNHVVLYEIVQTLNQNANIDRFVWKTTEYKTPINSRLQ